MARSYKTTAKKKTSTSKKSKKNLSAYLTPSAIRSMNKTNGPYLRNPSLLMAGGGTLDRFKNPAEVLSDFNMNRAKNYAASNAEETAMWVNMGGNILADAVGSFAQGLSGKVQSNKKVPAAQNVKGTSDIVPTGFMLDPYGNPTPESLEQYENSPEAYGFACGGKVKKSYGGKVGTAKSPYQINTARTAVDTTLFKGRTKKMFPFGGEVASKTPYGMPDAPSDEFFFKLLRSVDTKSTDEQIWNKIKSTGEPIVTYNGKTYSSTPNEYPVFDAETRFETLKYLGDRSGKEGKEYLDRYNEYLKNLTQRDLQRITDNMAIEQYGSGGKIRVTPKTRIPTARKTSTIGEPSDRVALVGFKNFPPNFAGGGTTGQQKIPVEVEGGEMAKLPNGNSIDFFGDPHERGGIDAALPEGTDIYSKRIRVYDSKSGKKISMAERERRRTSLEDRINKHLKGNPTDKITKQTLERVGKIHGQEREKDMAYQELVDSVQKYGEELYCNGGKVKKAANGLRDLDFSDMDWEGMGQNLLKNMGNLTAFAGDIYSSFAPLQLVKEQFAHRIPNVDTLQNYGKESMELYDQALSKLSGQEDEALKDVERMRVNNTSLNRKSARSVNTMNAMDLMSQVQANQAGADINTQFANLMSQMLTKKADQKLTVEQMRSYGKAQKLLADQQDLASFYTQLGVAKSGVGTGMQMLGKDYNEMMKNKLIEQLMNYISKYGFGFDKKGNLTKTDQGVAVTGYEPKGS